jgi:hypothetical protein
VQSEYHDAPTAKFIDPMLLLKTDRLGALTDAEFVDLRKASTEQVSAPQA